MSYHSYRQQPLHLGYQPQSYFYQPQTSLYQPQTSLYQPQTSFGYQNIYPPASYRIQQSSLGQSHNKSPIQSPIKCRPNPSCPLNTPKNAEFVLGHAGGQNIFTKFFKNYKSIKPKKKQPVKPKKKQPVKPKKKQPVKPKKTTS
jgi:hypothetical protein